MSPNFPWEWRCSCWAVLNCFLKDWVLDSLPFLAAVEDCSFTYSCRLQRFHERVRKTHCDKIFGQRNLLLSDSIWRLINVFQNSHPFKSSTIWWLDRHKFTTYHLLMAALMRDCSVCLWCSSSGRVIRPWCLSSVRHRPSEMRQQSLYPFIVEPVPDAYLLSESSVPDAYPLTESSVPDAYPLSKSSVPDAYPLTESSVRETHPLSGPSWWGAAQCSSWCSFSGRAIRPWCLYSVRHQLSEMLVSKLCALSIAVSEWLIRQTRMITVVNLIIFLHYYLAPWGLRWK